MDGAPFLGASDGVQVKLESDESEDVKPLVGRKRARPFGSEPFSEREETAIRQKLDVALSRKETAQRPGPGGCRLTYIEGWKVINDANQIFGFNGWSSQIIKIDVRFIEENHSRFSACVSATVRVTLRDGCSREDRGGGVADNMRSKGEAILKAEKEAVTDATKRTLKNFGLRLGLSLYDRDHLREMNRPQPRESSSKMIQPVLMNGNRTPVPNRTAPLGGNGHAAKVPRMSPVTPGTVSRAANLQGPNFSSPGGAPSGGQAAQAAQIELQRQQAIARRHACLRAQAAQNGTNNLANASHVPTSERAAPLVDTKGSGGGLSRAGAPRETFVPSVHKSESEQVSIAPVPAAPLPPARGLTYNSIVHGSHREGEIPGAPVPVGRQPAFPSSEISPNGAVMNPPARRRPDSANSSGGGPNQRGLHQFGAVGGNSRGTGSIAQGAGTGNVRAAGGRASIGQHEIDELSAMAFTDL